MSIFSSLNPITIVIADDHEIVRAGIKRLLLLDKTFKILGDASNGKDAIEIAAYHKPHIVLLDILMPMLNGVDAIPLIKKLSPDSMVVMLTAFEDLMHLEKAIAAGADGYLSKDISAEDLCAALKKVVLGERVLSKSILILMGKKYNTNSNNPQPVSITKREQEILNLVAMGMTSNDMAEKLNISIRTVESHRYNLLQKLECTNAAGLVRYALTNENAIL